MLSTIEDIKKILISSEKETINYELKRFEKILSLNDKNKKDIGCEIAAFANRNGGKIIFGIENDGTFEKRIALDIDKIKANIHNICFDHISPAIETNTQYIEDDDNQVLIVHIPKRKGIPHAYVEKRSGPEISNRIYYIRTSHGKKLVSDNQLQWLFQNTGEPKYSNKFRIGFELDKEMNLLSGVTPFGNYEFTYFRELLKPKEKESILKNSNLPEFLNGLMPFLLLKSLSVFFKDSWHIGITKGFDRLSSGPLITSETILSAECNIHEIPVLGDSYIQSLPWDFKNILKELITYKFHVPLNTSIEIRYNQTSDYSIISFRNPGFSIELRTGMLSGGSGPHQKGVRYDLLSKRYPVEMQQEYLHFDAACYLSATFNYPEYDMSEFEKHLQFYTSLITILEYEWDFEAKRREQPSNEILLLDDKLNEIIEFIRIRSQFNRGDREKKQSRS